MTLEVLAPGPLTTVQDLGRPGHAALGVPRSGAFDRESLRRANRLVGNAADAAALEITLGGLWLRALAAVTVAVTGAACPGVAWGEAVTLAAGSELRLGPPATGLRSYLAVRGGVVVDPVLGSCATDTLSGLGPPPLTAGDVVRTGAAPPRAVSGALAPGPARVREIAVRLGPRDDWFTPDGRAALTTTFWRVRAECDRVGVRLDGPPLTRARAGELPSEAVRPGAVQVPGDGRPVVFGPDAPVTGGYPVVAVLLDERAVDAVGQLRPGDGVRFTAVR